MSQSADIEKDLSFRDVRLERGDAYVYRRFTEANDPESARIARQLHAAGYLGENFVNDAAVSEDGSLAEDIDKARGERVEYYLGEEVGEKGEMTPRSTLRKVHISPGGSVEELPAFQLTEANLYPHEKEALLARDHAYRTVREISAFAHTPDVGPMAGFELLRTIMQDAQGSHETWFFSMVSERLESLIKNFGPEAVRKIGDPVPIDDDRVEGVTLTPAIVETDTFLQQVYDAVMNETEPQKRMRYERSLKFFTDGLAEHEMSDEIKAYRKSRAMNDGVRPHFTISARTTGSLESQIEGIGANEGWQQPEEFDFSSWADRREVSRRIEDGRITRTVDTLDAVAEELFELQNGKGSDQEAARSEFVDDLRAEGLRFGRWFHFPWNHVLVRYPEQPNHQALRTFRNRNIVTDDEQDSLLKKTVGVFGLSVGSHVVERALHSGIGGRYVLADFDSLSPTNVNRIHAGMPKVGIPKIDIAAQKISEVDPYVQQVHFREGITSRTLAELAETGPDIIFDEVDDFRAKALLRKFAAVHGVPLVMATDVGDRSILDVERHDLGNVKPFNGRLKKESVEAMIAGELSDSERMKITVSLIGLSNASPRLLDSVRDERLAGFPQLETTAATGGSLAALAAREILLGRKLDSGRYVLAPKSLLDLSGTPLPEAVASIRQFIQHRPS